MQKISPCGDFGVIIQTDFCISLKNCEKRGLRKERFRDSFS